MGVPPIEGREYSCAPKMHERVRQSQSAGASARPRQSTESLAPAEELQGQEEAADHPGCDYGQISNDCMPVCTSEDVGPQRVDHGRERQSLDQWLNLVR